MALVRRNTYIAIIFGCLIVGVVLGRLGFIAPVLFLAAGLIVLAASIRQRRLLPLGLMLLALTLGQWRVGVWATRQAHLTNLIGSTVTLTGTIADDPSTGATDQVDFKLDTPTGEFSVHDYPVRVQRGYLVRVDGKVKPGFGNATVEMSFPKIQVISAHQSWLERLRQHFFTGIRTALPEPIASFGLGLLVGIRALIPKQMQTELALVGLSHLVAVSGYNLTIIVRAADRALARLGRGVALAGSLWLIAGFLIVTGASASIVRASLVSVLSLLAAYYGRRFHPMVIILIAAGATAAYDPKYLTDLGWLLSFLAFYGILVLAPAIEARVGHPKLIAVRLFIESCSAQLLTLPLILCFFGTLSVVAPLTNLIVLPLVPLAMALTFVAGLGGMVIPPFAGWLAWPAALLLGFMLKVIDAFAALAWAGSQQSINLVAMLGMYGLIVTATIVLIRTNRQRFMYTR
jgi:competence protein ComEC